MIEHGIPIPESTEAELHIRIPDLLQMKVGDSTLIDENEIGRVGHIELAVWGMKRNQQHKLVHMDKVLDGKARIWRTR
jgi:hypothetical protein